MNIPVVLPKYVKDKNGAIRRFDKLPENVKLNIIQRLEKIEIDKIKHQRRLY